MDGESIPAPGVVVQLSEQPASRLHQWTDDRKAVLATLWGEGKSGRQIAERLGGVSRNAVIGMVHRMGLPGRPTRVSATRGTRKGCSVRFKFGQAIVTRMATVPLPPPQVDDVPRKPLDDLEDNDCRYPIDLPGSKEQHFCALERSRRIFRGMRSPYCEGHHARCINDVQ